ncbi:uncharacterized protein LOC109410650 [Aedes albopictus]|uniref:Uncharacterized protein n=1 Tax=Aedes albopictus TaxID=7160 RepID=A0ABM1XZY8_AEDAL|nr:uncharacterized protein LOC109410650 isoform X2 [Aedes albopictus]
MTDVAYPIAPIPPVSIDPKSKITPTVVTGDDAQGPPPPPRTVSFNRDVHVKRIGSRSEPRTFPTNSNVRKEPQNLSAEALRREAEFVLAQADRLDRARSRSNSISKDDKFNSLPSRKSRGKTTLTRSSSDASSKKPQKNLLHLFNKTKHDSSVKSTNLEEKPRITVSRSKSDVGQALRQVRDRRTPRRNTQELKNDPLTPIIEASPVEYTKPVDPLTAYAQQNKPSADSQDLNISTSRPTSKPVMDTIALLRQNSKSQERLHSSQLPPDKPNLTKGVTVENIVKRLSTERHTSPPPAQIVRDGFSYTRPGEPIVYAQVVCNNDSKEKHTVRNQYLANTSDEDMKKSSPIDLDLLDRMATKEYLAMKRPSPPLPKYTLDETDNFPRTKLKPYNSDEDEGLGIDYSKRFSTSYLKTTTTTAADSFTNSDEDHITPTVKYTPPYVGHNYSASYRGQADGKEYFPEFHELSQRREILESRIRNRIGSREVLDLGSPDRDTGRRGSASRYENYHRTGRRSLDRMASASPVRRSTLSPPPVHQEDLTHRRNSSNQYVESFVTKTVVNRDGRPYSEEYVERFKYPSRNLEDVRTTRTTFERDGSVERTEVKNFKRNLGEKSHSRTVMDKGDSGIENDFRKDSLNSEFPTGRKYTMAQNIHACESFLRHERNHTNGCLRKPKRTYSYRERSIDDGSRFDPRLDDYPDSGRGYQKELKSSMKQEKKTGGLAKVKQFMSSTKKKLVRMGESDKKDSRQSSIRSDERSRYDEQYHSKVPDIANRRRLSTPKSSPSTTKRSLSFKSTTKTGESSKASRTDWFKSFDRLSRKKPQEPAKSQFGGSDMKSSSAGGTKQQKNLRFFGDTDTEYASMPPSRPSRSKSSLSKVDKRYQSAYDLEATPKIRETRNRSTSMQNLDEEDRRNESKRKDLYDISEYSTSYRTQSPSPSYPVRRQHSMNRDYTPDRSLTLNRKSYSRSRENSVDRVEGERYQRSSRSRSEQQNRKPPSGPQKPARSFERRGSLTREMDRIQDSSGTEGESSQQSQRSVVFLHATTVGDIPHPHIANAHRMAYSRESLNSSNNKKVQPMTRTVSRSVSVLAPWKPKHIRDGYEINYHNDQQPVVKPISTLPRPLRNRSSSQSTLSRTKQKTRRSHTGSKDDLDSDKSSSFDNSRSAHRTQESGGGHTTHSLPRRSRDGATSAGSSKTNTLQKHRRN